MIKKAWIMIIFLLPGCGTLIDWGKSRMYQGNLIKFNRCAIRDYLRWVTVYDEFTTVAMLDVLWLSDPVRTLYAKENSFREGKSFEHYQAFLRRQIEENNYFITFYVLTMPDLALGDSVSEWKVILMVDGTSFYPTECKAVDLPYEYQEFLKKRITPFKTSYKLLFNAKTSSEAPIVTSETQSVALHFRRADREVVLSWNFDNSGTLKKQKESGGQPIFIKKEPVDDRYYEETTHE